jgi:hypothetical protein
MRRIAILALLMASLASGGPVRALPFSYAREHAAWCAASMNTQFARTVCVTRAWCAAHWNDDRITRISCDPMRSRADQSLPRITLSPAGLGAARDLTEAETHLDCTPPFHSREDSVCAWGRMRLPVGEKNDSLLPPGMKTAKLGLYAQMAVWTFPVTVVRLGIASARSGTITLSWNRNGNGPRVTESATLNAGEIARLIAALNESDFWRSPHEPRHMGATDGEIATVAVGIAGRQNQVNDSIGDSEAVGVSILINALSGIIRNHWRNVPGG